MTNETDEISMLNELPLPTTVSGKRVLILGANGRLGRELVQAFADAGWSVFAQVRRALVDAPSRQIKAVQISIDDPIGIARAASGASVVIHAMNAKYTRWATDAIPLADAAIAISKHLNARLIFAGNVYNFGSPMPSTIRENAVQLPTTRKGRIRRETELRFAAAAAGAGETGIKLRAIVIRAGDFYGGEGAGSWMDMAVAKDIRKGKITYPGALDICHAWAYLPDLARTFVAVAEVEHQCAPFEKLHFQGHSLTGREMTAALIQAAIRAGVLSYEARVRIVNLPWGVIRAVAWAVPMWGELLEMRYLWDDAHRLDDTRLRELVGDLPTTPLATALDKTLVQIGIGKAESQLVAA
jgi:nucleoside-diphosphate-sugar epimerase